MWFSPSKSSSAIDWWRLLLLLFWVCSAAASAADSDKSALLELKNSLSDPSGLLAGWNLSSDHCSGWFGVLCDSNSRVSSLNITGDGAKGTERFFFCDDSAQFPIYGYGFRRNCAGSDGKLVGKLLPSIAKLTELRILSLPFNGLYGQLPSEIWGMPKLEVFNLEGNLFSGSMPQFQGMKLKSLRFLNLGFNNISGELPDSLSNLSSLEVLNLAGNSVNGTVPRFIGQFSAVYLSFNQLTGSIPSEIGKDCGKLEHLDLSGNFLGGQIPNTIGSCSELRSLLLFSNMLEERFPPEIGTLQRLEVLDVSRNTLSGSIPIELGNCTNLSVLILSNLLDPLQGGSNITKNMFLDELRSMNDEFNYFQGNLPAEITKLPNLKILWAPRTNFEGSIPSNWGSCQNLEMVNLRQNDFTGTVPSQLGGCSKLSFLDLGLNKLSGELTEEIQIPCMTVFDVSGNALSGPIPSFRNINCGPISNPSAAYMASLAYKAEVGWDSTDTRMVFHNFGLNSFNGTISSLPISSSVIGQKTVYAFLAGENDLTGPFPEEILRNCEGVDSVFINVSYNKISGPVPLGLGASCGSRILLDASGNRISGSIPEILRLAALNLSWNSLDGPIPAGFGLVNDDLEYLSLAGNKLNGSIPSSFGGLQSLQVLDLSSNGLSGEIPNGLLKLTKLRMLLLNNNKLSGQLPSGLTTVTMLTSFNVSFNNLSGPLPSNTNNLLRCDSVRGNHFTSPCKYSVTVPSAEKSGDPQNYAAAPSGTGDAPKSSFNSIEIASIASASAIVSVLILLIILFVYTRKWKPRRGDFGSVKKEVTVFEEIRVQLTYENVVRATAFFNSSNCIGSGGFGATYKAEVSPGVLLAIKRLAVGRFQGVQQFHAEIKTLGRLRHPNLVTLVGYHASETEMFLIYNYLPGGNLERFIQERPTRPMDWRVLHKIALDVARALAYLHDTCVPRVLHRDVKPSNILLDDDCNAYLSDFGLARLLGTSETHATTGVAGTFGYVAPEYAMTCRVSDKADVYSYGVVLLELLSDKKALDPSFSSFGNGFNIVPWACMLLRQGRAKEFFSSGLWEVGPHDDLVEVLHLAVVCTVDSLSTRPTMKQVAHRLKKLQPPSC